MIENRYSTENWNFSSFFSQFSIPSWSEKGHEPSRAELKILQLELWLKPAWLGLITTIYIYLNQSQVSRTAKILMLW